MYIYFNFCYQVSFVDWKYSSAGRQRALLVRLCGGTVVHLTRLHGTHGVYRAVMSASWKRIRRYTFELLWVAGFCTPAMMVETRTVVLVVAPTKSSSAPPVQLNRLDEGTGRVKGWTRGRCMIPWMSIIVYECISANSMLVHVSFDLSVHTRSSSFTFTNIVWPINVHKWKMRAAAKIASTWVRWNYNIPLGYGLKLADWHSNEDLPSLPSLPSHPFAPFACWNACFVQVDAGADFVISQFFYDTGMFLGYVERCRQVGISCPIIPGIMAIQVRIFQ